MRVAPPVTRRGIAAILGGGLLLVLGVGGYAVTRVGSGAGRTELLLVLGTSVLSLVTVGGVLGRRAVGSVSRVRRRVEAVNDGDHDVDFRPDRPGELGRLDRQLESLTQRLAETEAAYEEAAADRDRLQRRLNGVERTVSDYSEVTRRCSSGEYDHRMDADAENEALAELAEEFNAMMDDLEATLDRLEGFTTDVAASSEEVTESAESVRSASEQVARSIQKISEGTDRQHENLQAASVEMNALSTTIEEIASSSDEVADLAERTANAGERGRAAAREAVRGMDRIETVSADAVEEMERLTEEIAAIDELAEVIANLADKTNVLALNANIEASRADGTRGNDGFGAVAAEIKDLANDTKRATESIEERVDAIQSKTEAAADSVRETGDRIDDNTEAVHNVIAALEEIAGYAQETNTGVQDISAATEQQAASTEEVVAMVEEATTISERTSREARNVATAAREQTEAISRVSNNVDDLSSRADGLLETLAIDPDDGDSGGAATTDDGEPVTDPTAQVEAILGERSDAAATGDTDAGDRTGSLDALALREAVVEAYPGDEPPWHAMARIQLKTNVDLETAEPGDEIPPEKRQAVVEAAEEVTGQELDLPDPDPSGEFSADDGDAATDPVSAVEAVLGETGTDDSRAPGETTEEPPLDAHELRGAVADAYPGDEPPWHAMARIQLKTNVDLETAEPGDEIPPEKREAVLEAAEEVTGETIDVSRSTPADGADASTTGRGGVLGSLDASTPGREATAARADTGRSRDTWTTPVDGDDGSAPLDAHELRGAVADAYPGDEPPWHAMARIQLKTNVDLETAEPGDEIPPEKRDAVLEAAEEVTGRPIDVPGTESRVVWETPSVASQDTEIERTAAPTPGGGGSVEGRDPHDLKEAVVEAYPGDEPPWHAIARIQLKTNYDLENAEPGDTVSQRRFEELLAAAREVTGTDLDV